MKSKRTLIILVSMVALVLVAGLIIREREPYAFEEISRFAMLGPEGGELSAAEVQTILQQSSQGPVVVTSEQNDVSEKLALIPVIPPKQSRPDPDLNELRPLPKRGGGGPRNVPPANFVDPVLQDSLTPVLNIPSPLQNFDGVNNVNGVLPPDTNGDVGPNHYMQWVNLSFAIYSKTGTLLYGPAAGNTLWSGFGGACETTNDGDPIVQYDHLADRWMVSQFALPNYPSGPFYQCIAVSQTGNPTGAWYRYQFQISATKLNDYPHFGVWSDGYYMSINQFVGNTWGGAGAVAFERDKMLLGQPAQAVYFDLYATDPNLGGMLPSDLDGPVPPAGTPNYFLQADDNGFGYPQDQLEMWAFHVNWANPGASTFTNVGNLATAAFDSNMCAGSRNCIPQPGKTPKLDAIADRLMYRLQYRNFGAYQTIVANHTVDVNSADHAGIRWYELRNSGGGWSIFQQGTFSPDATHRWMGSAAMDSSGNIGLGYSTSSSTLYPAIRYTGRVAADPLGTLPQGEGTIINGTGAQTHSASRWGDYSSLSVDPVDGCTFWFTSEYLQTTGASPWRTRIGSFQLPGCGGGPTTGTLQGTVTDATTSAAISGVTVTIVGGASTTTNASGFYQFTSVAPGTYNVTAAKTGYNTGTNSSVTVTAGATTTSNFALTATAPTTGTLQGTVTDATTSAAINGATVTIIGGASTTTNASGFYQFTNVTPGTYNITAAKAGYNTGTNTGVSVTAGNTTTSNFALTAAPPTTGTLQGTVTDASTSAAINGATVTIVGGASTTTNASGFYQFTNVAAGTYSVTAAKTGYGTGTNTGVSVTAGNTTTSNFALTPSTTTSTGFLAPTAQAAQTTNAGDNNGYQTNPANALANDGIFAVDSKSGTNTNTSCTNTGKDKHHFSNYNFSIPGAAVIQGIEVRLDALAESTGNAPHICVEISWNGGATWAVAEQTGTLTTGEATYLVGTPTDLWGHAWTVGEFSNANFRVRVTDVASNSARTFSLDYIAVNVTYQP